MQIDIITGVFFFFLAMGIFCSALSAYWFVEDLINKYRGKSKTKKTAVIFFKSILLFEYSFIKRKINLICNLNLFEILMKRIN